MEIKKVMAFKEGMEDHTFEFTMGVSEALDFYRMIRMFLNQEDFTWMDKSDLMKIANNLETMLYDMGEFYDDLAEEFGGLVYD